MKFEEKLKRLEALVAKMESGEMSLDEMIVAFEEGQKLAGECSQDLSALRLRIEKVTRTGAIEEFKA